MNHRQKKTESKKKKVKSDNSENSAKAKRTIFPSVLIRMRRYLGFAVIYEKKHGITNAKGKEAIQYFDLVYFIVRFFFSRFSQK